MKDVSTNFDYDLAGLDQASWLEALDETSEEHGHFEALGRDHSAAFIDAGRTLLVSFEAAPVVRSTHADHAPLGWQFVKSHGWSSLTILAHEADDWFRGRAVFGYFDRMIDDGFFDDFDQVLFFGAGISAHAAAAYSVAAPDAKVLAIQPQASLSADVAAWDRRFLKARRLDFTSRFGYAPQMVETASQVWIVHDPMIAEDAMHAHLFDADNTTHLRTPHLGESVGSEFMRMGILNALIEQAQSGTLDGLSFAKLWRARLKDLRYARNTMRRIEETDAHPKLLARWCRVFADDGNRPLFAKKLAELEANGVKL